MAVYLDHNATTPLDDEVLEAMLPFLKGEYGNPSSLHSPGHRAKTAVNRAREQVAALVGAHPSQVVFTSGGTESNNTALKGVARRLGSGMLAITGVEHPSVGQPARALARHGWGVRVIDVDSTGGISAAGLADLDNPEINLVSVMWANNETGVVLDVESAAQRARAHGAIVHTDAVQAAGKLPLDFAASAVQLMSISAHKLNGPKGIGALIVDKAVDFEPLNHGGGQEQDRRGGTLNVPGIVGFGVAAERAQGALAQHRAHLAKLRDHLERRLLEQVSDAVIFGAGSPRLDNTAFFAIPGIHGETLVMELDRAGMAVSSGSACGSEHHQPSPVLRAMGVDEELSRCAVRVSLGKENELAEVDRLVDLLVENASRLRRMAALGWD